MTQHDEGEPASAGFDIFTCAPPQVRDAMLKVLDDARAQLVAGELRCLICVPVPMRDNTTFNGVLAGEHSVLVFELEKAKTKLVHMELQMEAQRVQEQQKRNEELFNTVTKGNA
jgi:hypothetical protein